MLCNPPAAAHFGWRLGSSILPLVPEPRVVGGGSSSLSHLRGTTQLCPRETEQEKRTRWLVVCSHVCGPWDAPQMGLVGASDVLDLLTVARCPGRAAGGLVPLALQPVSVQLLASYPYPRDADYPSARSTPRLPAGVQACQKGARPPRALPRSLPDRAQGVTHGCLFQPRVHPGRPPSSPRPMVSPT